MRRIYIKEVVKLLRINEKYYIDSDSCNYILIEKHVIQDKKSKNYGKETFKNIAYYGTIESLYKGLIEKELKENINLLNNIEQIISIKADLVEKVEV